ncbi:uncharacterized protein LOC103513167 [Diaphorina citri]|uniref:Uncharacterized protein LOC103513167 n=1 Tax=Diaphorina citri TaxID=121845 RepID=A0A1S3D7Q7_DIACI|nr:uncharacterized protein LOC103513167 [Diaphorina citri]
MSGVISPTNLSLFSSPVTVTSPMRTVSSVRHPSSNLPRWTPTSTNNTGPTPFISLDEDYMMTPLISGNNNETSSALIDDERYFTPEVHATNPMETNSGLGPTSNGPSNSPQRVSPNTVSKA